MKSLSGDLPVRRKNVENIVQDNVLYSMWTQWTPSVVSQTLPVIGHTRRSINCRFSSLVPAFHECSPTYRSRVKCFATVLCNFRSLKTRILNIIIPPTLIPQYPTMKVRTQRASLNPFEKRNNNEGITMEHNRWKNRQKPQRTPDLGARAREIVPGNRLELQHGCLNWKSPSFWGMLRRLPPSRS